MAGRRKVPDGSSLLEDINSGEVIGDNSVLADDRPWEVWYSPYGEPHRLPADPIQAKILKAQKWTQTKPRNKKAKPTQLKMRNGSIFDLSSTTADLSEGERNKLSGGGQAQAVAPTATYYSPNGDVLPNLPADPQSMREYMELGLSLTPPNKAAGELVELKIAQSR